MTPEVESMSNWPTDDEHIRRDGEQKEHLEEERRGDRPETADPARPDNDSRYVSRSDQNYASDASHAGAAVPGAGLGPAGTADRPAHAPVRQWRWEGRRRRNPAAASLAVVAVVSAIIGGMISLMLFPYLSAYFGPKPHLAEPPKGTNITQMALPNTNDPPAVYVAQKVGPAVVAIINRQQGADIWGRPAQQITGGTGVIIDANGYIVTNNHVVASTAGLTVTLSDGRKFSARIIGADPASDLAVIKIDATNLPVAELGDSDKLRVGEIAVAIGNPVDPEAFQSTVTQGVISGLNRKVEQGDRILTLIQTDAAINPGNSGGPLCNAAGQVIGINVAKIPESQNVEGMGLAIPINVARPIINELIAKGKVSRVWLGTGLVDKETARYYYNISFNQGLLVGKVYSNSPAEKAGIREGDIIVKADGQTVNSFAELRTILDTKRPGNSIKLDLLRNGRGLTVTVVLEEQPADFGQ